jgi:uncharacterized protein YjbI with pentapeptide repeats
MANAAHLSHLKNGVVAWNEWRDTCAPTPPDLFGADLSRHGVLHTALLLPQARDGGAVVGGSGAGSAARLRGVNFGGTDLRYANLAMADLSDAKLAGARLSFSMLARARLDRADCGGAYLHMAQLTRASAVAADFSGADFSYAVLSGTDLQGANLTDATMIGCLLNDVDLSEVVGLETVTHIGPSSIGVDTLSRSGGRIPASFLRGVGLTDEMMSIARRFAEIRPTYRTCFLSYSHADSAFTERLYADLQNAGVRVWYVAHDIDVGDVLWEKIDYQIRNRDRLIVVCSESSLSSLPVLREIERAILREDNERTSILLPIRIDDFVFEGWQNGRRADVVRKAVGDFTGWKHDSAKYRQSLGRLLRALRIEREDTRMADVT